MEETPLDLGSQSLLGYLPAMVIKKIIDDNKDLSKNLPYHYMLTTVSLFADISGFTKLSESFAKLGRIGPEFLAFSLNRYMEKLINIIGKNGGDIFKFAGDALLVIWPDGSDLSDSCKRAIQCALDIQAELHNVEISKDKKLSIKIGIGVGEVRILFVGGQFERAEYLIVGEAMRVACLSETKATNGGQTIVHESVHNLVSNFYESEEIGEDEDDHGHGDETKGMKFFRVLSLTNERIQVRADAYLMRTKFNANKVRLRLPLLKSFVPKAISIYLDLEKERWSKEIRMLTIMFLNLKVDLSQTNSEEGILRIQHIVKTVQRCIYMTKGALNKFLMDDKGSVMLIVWGLPPISEINDASRAVYTALELVKELPKYKCGAYMGITTGSCFTGVCGTIGGRREYSLLGEVVNLSARHMQQACIIGKQTKSPYEIILCEKTKNAIQNDIACEWVSEGMLKGFADNFQFYSPIKEIKTIYPDKKEVFIPQLRTHKNNFYLGRVNEHELKNELPMSLTKSIIMVSRKVDLESFKKDLTSTFKSKGKELILIRGVYGSGKTLFVRKAFYEFIEVNKELKNRYLMDRSEKNLDFVFVSNQNPRSYNIPFNGFNSIFKQILNNMNIYTNLMKKRKNYTQPYGTEKIDFKVSLLGEILLENNCYSVQKYIEEILEIKLEDHLTVESHNDNFDRIFPVISIQDIDPYFKRRDFKNFSKTIIRFFISLLKHYKQLLNFPLYLIIEDCQSIDSLSCDFIKEIATDPTLDSIALISTLQDPICRVQKEGVLFSRVIDEFRSDKVYIMDNITDYTDVNELIRRNLSQLNMTIKSVNHKLLDIILKKSFKGNPLYILDIVDSMIKAELAFINKNLELVPTKPLLLMESEGDYCSFPVPIRIEKYVGHILDCYSDTKDIITLKFAAVIGNLFSVATLNSLNEFNSLTFEDILSILYNFENKGILDVMYDLNIHHSVFMFVIPFCREVLYQRMLIEQKNDLHLLIARNMQKSKFSYMPHHQELASLNQHLKLSEKSLIDYIKEDSTKVQDPNQNQTGLLNINNLKLCVIKEIIQNIQKIENHVENSTKNMIACIKYGDVYKKSDTNISWEKRYMAVSQNKIFYWYDKIEHETNKVPLGYVELKHLYQVEVLQDFYFGNRKNVFQIHVAQWYKKDMLMGPRKYIFSCDNRESVYAWVISLNFMRVKALHDEFSVNFGVVSLPLFAVEIEEKKFQKNIKKKFVRINLDENKRRANQGVSVIYNNLIRKSVVSNTSSSTGTGNTGLKVGGYSNTGNNNGSGSVVGNDKGSNSVMRRISQAPMRGTIGNELEADEIVLEKKLKLKQQFDLLWKYSMVNFFSYIQDIIFNIENTGQEDDLVTVPFHVNELKDIPCITGDPFLTAILKKKDKNVAVHQTRNSLGEMPEVREDINESKLNSNSKESDVIGTPNHYSNFRVGNDDESLNNNANTMNTLYASPLQTPVLTNQIAQGNQVKGSLKENAVNSIVNSMKKTSSDNIVIRSNLDPSKNNSNDNNDKIGVQRVFSNNNDLSSNLLGNDDEEKTDIQKKTGLLCVGKNLMEFDLDVDGHDGVDDFENFFNHKKKESKKEKISFNFAK